MTRKGLTERSLNQVGLQQWSNPTANNDPITAIDSRPDISQAVHMLAVSLVYPP